MIDGCISSYCAVLNSEERMLMVKEANEVTAILAEIYNDRQEEKELKKKKTLEEDRKKKEKKELKTIEKESQAIKDKAKAAELLLEILNDDRGEAARDKAVSKMIVPNIRLLLQYEFDDEIVTKKGMKKTDLVSSLQKHLTHYIDVHKSKDTGNKEGVVIQQMEV